MKNPIRNLIREFIQEMELEEDYPASFDMETFKSLSSHAGRNRYAAEHLQKLAQGSSRIVYKIDDEKVLKLAKNDKGIVQNETEISWGNDSYFGDILANIFDYDDKDLWVEMELARKVTKSEFKKLTGFDINDVHLYFLNWVETNRGKRGIYGIDPELEKRMEEDQFLSSIKEFSQAADIQIGDFGVASSYGIVKRDGHDTLVIIDYGLTKDVYSTHYEKKPARMWEGNEASNEITPSTVPNTMSFWHGGNLDDYDEVIAQKTGRYEYGPGLYVTTHYDTAQKYAKGSRKLYLITVEKGVDIDDAYINIERITNFLNTYAIGSKRKEILKRLSKYTENDKAPASIFNNLVLNHKAIPSTKTKYLRSFLVDNGIDYEMVDNPFGWGEKMMVLYNMKKIVDATRIKSGDKISTYDLPTIFN